MDNDKEALVMRRRFMSTREKVAKMLREQSHRGKDVLTGWLEWDELPSQNKDLWLEKAAQACNLIASSLPDMSEEDNPYDNPVDRERPEAGMYSKYETFNAGAEAYKDKIIKKLEG